MAHNTYMLILAAVASCYGTCTTAKDVLNLKSSGTSALFKLSRGIGADCV